MKNKLGFFISFFFLIFLSGCNYIDALKALPTPINFDVGDGGFLSLKPCGPPCFWGLVPGLSTIEDVGTVLKVRGLENKCESFNNGDEWISCSGVMIINFNHMQVVDSIGFFPKMKIQEVITGVGEPDSVEVICGRGASLDRPCNMILYFDEIKTEIHMPEQDSKTYKIVETDSIETVAYFSDEKYLSEKYPETQQIWYGFGEYKPITQ